MNYLLFVDDEQAFLKINRTYFEGLGYTVFTAMNRDEMEHCLHTQPVDCIILDIMMPGNGNSGYELCRSIRQTLSVPVIFLTSLTEKECLYQGFGAGADDYMTKPYELKELELRIQARINQMKGNVRQNDILSFPVSL